MAEPGGTSNAGETGDRLVRIESLLAHMQHDIEQLHQTLTLHFERFQEIDRRFERLERDMELRAQPEENRDPGDERPPHW